MMSIEQRLVSLASGGDYKVIWRDDCGEQHETIVHADNARRAEMNVFQENENCLEIVGTVLL
jgi:hypothetical protein